MTSRVWLNGEFRTKPWTQTVPEATQSPPHLIEDEVSDPESALSDSEPEGTQFCGYSASGIDNLLDVVDGYQSLRCYISSFNGLDNQMFLLWDMQLGGKTALVGAMS